MSRKCVDLNSIYKSIISISREYLIALSIYLTDLFILHIGEDLNYINAIFWAILIGVCFDKIFVYKDSEAKRNKAVYRVIRCVFVVMNFIAFGINIFV